MSFVDYFAATVALGTAVTFGLQKMLSEVVHVKSSVDGRAYLVRDLPDKQQAADFLAQMNIIVLDLIDKLRINHPDDARVKRLERRYDPDSISEGSAKSGYTSYSINKGEKIVVCIRQNDDSFAKINDVLYVVIHELAHLATNEIGHTPLFWKNFTFLLQNAVAYKIYEYQDYGRFPAPYCGIQLSSTILGKSLGDAV